MSCATLGSFLDFFVPLVFFSMKWRKSQPLGIIARLTCDIHVSCPALSQAPGKCSVDLVSLPPSHPLSILGGDWVLAEEERSRTKRAQDRKAEDTKDKLPDCPFLPRASPEGGDEAGAAGSSGLIKNGSPLRSCHH